MQTSKAKPIETESESTKEDHHSKKTKPDYLTSKNEYFPNSIIVNEQKPSIVANAMLEEAKSQKMLLCRYDTCLSESRSASVCGIPD